MISNPGSWAWSRRPSSLRCCGFNFFPCFSRSKVDIFRLVMTYFLCFWNLPDSARLAGYTQTLRRGRAGLFRLLATKQSTAVNRSHALRRALRHHGFIGYSCRVWRLTVYPSSTSFMVYRPRRTWGLGFARDNAFHAFPRQLGLGRCWGGPQG